MRFRPINDKDRLDWSRMRTALWPKTSDDHLAEIGNYFSGNSHDVEHVIVAETDDKNVIGFIELNIRNFAEGSRRPKVPYVEAWYVQPDYQSKGVGTALMKLAEEWAKGKGYKELASDTEIANTSSIQKHLHLGFQETERIVCFLKKLSDT